MLESCPLSGTLTWAEVRLMQGPSRPREAGLLTRERAFLTGSRQGFHAAGPTSPIPCTVSEACLAVKPTLTIESLLKGVLRRQKHSFSPACPSGDKQLFSWRFSASILSRWIYLRLKQGVRIFGRRSLPTALVLLLPCFV